MPDRVSNIKKLLLTRKVGGTYHFDRFWPSSQKTMQALTVAYMYDHSLYIYSGISFSLLSFQNDEEVSCGRLGPFQFWQDSYHSQVTEGQLGGGSLSYKMRGHYDLI